MENKFCKLPWFNNLTGFLSLLTMFKITGFAAVFVMIFIAVAWDGKDYLKEAAKRLEEKDKGLFERSS